MRRLLRVLLGIFLLLVILLAGMSLLLSTQIGTDGLLALAKRVLPGELSYAQVRGRLIGPLAISNLHYRNGSTDFSLASAEFDWLPSALLSADLRILMLKADGIVIHLPASAPKEAETKPPALSDIRLPLGMEIAELSITNLQIFPHAAPQPVVIDGIWLKARTQEQTIVLENLAVKVPQANADLRGQLTPSGPYPLKFDLAWQFQHPQYGPLRGQGTLGGDLENLSLSHKLDGAVTAVLDGNVHAVLQEPNWSARLELAVPNLGQFAPPLAERELTGQLQTEGSLKSFKAGGKLLTSLPDIGKLHTDFRISGDIQTVVVDELKLISPDRPLSLSVQGKVNPADLQFAVTGEWQQLSWPFTATPQVESQRGTLIASGTPRAYTFKLNAQLQGPAIPKGSWNLEGQGSEQALANLDLIAQLLEGELKAKLSARWQPMVSWQTELSGQGLNPGAHWPQLPGKLNFTARNQGELSEGKLQTDILLTDLSGTLNGQPVQGKTQVSLHDQDLNVTSLSFKAGGAQLEAAGSLTQRWDLRWKLEVPNLNSLLPNAKGKITSSGSLTGPRQQPLPELNLLVQGFAFGESQIQRLRGEARVDLSGASRSQVNFTGEGLNLAGQAWQSLILVGSGTPAAHHLKANMAGAPGNFALALEGAVKEALWQGRLTALSALKTEIGDWQLENPAALRASAHQAGAERLCLTNPPTRICLQGQWDASSGANGRVTLERLIPRHFATLLPKDLRIDTSVGGEVAGARRNDGTLQGQANLEISPGKVNFEANGSPVQIQLGGGFLRAEVKGNDATGRFKLDLGDTGQLETNLRASNLTSQARLAGKLAAEVKKLDLVSLFVPQLQQVSGRLTANLDLSGTLPTPAVRGEVRLLDAAADIPEAGTRLQEVQLTASGDGQGPLRFSGSARSGPGKLNLTGQLEPSNGQLALAVKGDNFQAANSTDIQILISPDLTLSMVQKQVRVEGQVTIPKAYLSPPGGTVNRVNPSQDVVIVNAQQDQPGKGGLDIFAKIRVILGDDVHVAASGFKGQLKGNLLVEQTPQLAPRGSGNVEVAAGDYKIYGQEIQIERGRLLFSGGPIDNPGLDLRVARRQDEVTAGAQVRGTLKSPQLKLFSEPPMPDSSILSYLVFGRSPQENSEGESAMLFRAATALGMSGGNVLTKGLSESLGLDSFAFESGAGPKDASLVLGKYLTPDLYIGYGVGLFDALNTFKMRYRINKRFHFESTSNSKGSGADLTYTFER